MDNFKLASSNHPPPKHTTMPRLGLFTPPEQPGAQKSLCLIFFHLYLSITLSPPPKTSTFRPVFPLLRFVSELSKNDNSPKNFSLPEQTSRFSVEGIFTPIYSLNSLLWRWVNTRRKVGNDRMISRKARQKWENISSQFQNLTQ